MRFSSSVRRSSTCRSAWPATSQLPAKAAGGDPPPITPPRLWRASVSVKKQLPPSFIPRAGFASCLSWKALQPAERRFRVAEYDRLYGIMLLVICCAQCMNFYSTFLPCLSLFLFLSLFSPSLPDSAAHPTVDGDTNKVRRRLFTVSVFLL